LKLEGITRNAGKHAGGVVIAPSALTDFTPLYCEAAGEGVVTQLDKDDVEAIGLVKFDFLGLRTLTILNWALTAINAKRKQNGEAPIDLIHLPLDDVATYKLLQACNTTAVFQLESRISRDLIKRLQPDCFDELVALVAIIRPGVLQSGMLDEFIDRKHGRARITYLHPKLEPVLRPTYGVAVYQEQVMQMAQSLAGYSLGGADLLRRAMGKKKPEEMARQRAIFIDGAAKNGIDKHLANTIFDLMEKFAGYGFNKSHSAAYALISYQTAWLKAHYPAEFMAAVLSSDMDNTDKVVLFLNDCKNLGLKVLPPDINLSDYRFVVNAAGEIVYGLGAIKGVGQAAVEIILQARAADGPFKNLFDLAKRVDTRKVNKRVFEALIFSGAFDLIGPNRASLLESLPLAMRAAEQHEKCETSGQVDLFSMFEDEPSIELRYLEKPEWTKEERLCNEKAVLGFYLEGHPIERYLSELNKIVSASIAELVPEMGKTVRIAGFISNVKIVITKSGNRLAIVSLEDNTGRIDVTMFAENFTNARDILVEDQLAIIDGEVAVDTFSDSYRIRATKAMSLEQAREIYARSLGLKLSADQITNENLHTLYEILSGFREGKCPVVISYNNGDAVAQLALGDNWKIHPKEELLTKLRDRFGSPNVGLVY
jgi:DNA polymerase III subunit alpha